MHRMTFTLGVLLVVLVAAAPMLAVEPINTGRFSDLAIKGYDPVAYFQQSEAVAGDKNITHSWMGATWRFASVAHRDLFVADPGRYAPQFGGYCAYAVFKGSTASIDPEAWTVVDGKLYLNYSKKVREKWRSDIAGHIATAEKNWPRLLAE